MTKIALENDCLSMNNDEKWRKFNLNIEGNVLRK